MIFPRKPVTHCTWESIVAKKKTTKKKTAKKTTTKKVARKVTSKKTTKKKTAKKAPAKKTTTKKKTTKKKTAKKTTSKKVTKKKTAKKAPARKVTRKAAAPSSRPSGNRGVSAIRPVVPAHLPDPPKNIKTTLSRAQLNEYQQLLLEKRAELLGDIGTMEDGALRNKDASNLSNMPLHMADVGSDNYDQELTLGLVESERKLLREIDDALHRIKDKTYGMCLATGKAINPARLEIKPWAKYSIEAARIMEAGGNGNGNGHRY